MIEFRPITLKDKPLYESYLFDGTERGCEYAFANLYMWGERQIAVLHNHMLVLSSYNNQMAYLYPVGNGDKKEVLDAIIEDARERGIVLQMMGMCGEKRQGLEEFYPGEFVFFGCQSYDDYVYDINDLADLKGRKYHKKKNHYNRFKKNYPDYRVEPISKENIEAVKEMITAWYDSKLSENPGSDFDMEKIAVSRAISGFAELGMEGLVLWVEDKIAAVTMGSRMSHNMFDVHFEKARSDIDGAYTAINCEFANYIREKYPEIEFLNREEDLGIEGLRKAKESYYPHHMVAKCQARLKTDVEKDPVTIMDGCGERKQETAEENESGDC